MKKFMDQDFLLKTETAKRLYHEVAEKTPIIDYHCHLNPQEIAEDKHYESITEVWLGGDHYKWRIMRGFGVDEKYITGDASPKEKFLKWAEVMPYCIGNPLYHWTHLELRRYFGIEELLCPENAEDIWNKCNEMLRRPEFGARGLIKRSNVEIIGTTDDPVDDLEYHRLLAEDKTFSTAVAPSFRPDRALNIDKAGWREYICKLSEVSGIEINDLATLKEALGKRIDYFASRGCRASDHGLDRAVYAEASEAEINEVIRRGLAGDTVTADEADALKTELLAFCAGEYVRAGWAMQIHYNCLRNPNSKMLATLGPDTGFDCIGPDNGGRKLSALLDRLYREERLPRT
ncbi:MAG: glucuronate isomerase, partial [Oscillospiraceae bacterium]|nr:glucuronate isomerase [Oscillospiraceae bacterium]